MSQDMSQEGEEQGCPLGWVTSAPAAGLGLRPAFKSGNQLLPRALGLISNL